MHKVRYIRLTISTREISTCKLVLCALTSVDRMPSQYFVHLHILIVESRVLTVRLRAATITHGPLCTYGFTVYTDLYRVVKELLFVVIFCLLLLRYKKGLMWHVKIMSYYYHRERGRTSLPWSYLGQKVMVICASVCLFNKVLKHLTRFRFQTTAKILNSFYDHALRTIECFQNGFEQPLL